MRPRGFEPPLAAITALTDHHLAATVRRSQTRAGLLVGLRRGRIASSTSDLLAFRHEGWLTCPGRNALCRQAPRSRIRAGLRPPLAGPCMVW